MTNRKALPTLLLLLAAVVAFPGCAGKSKKWHFADWRPHKFWGKPDKPDPEVPERLVATWVDATLTKAGEIPKRGFGGRIVFFGEEGEDPVRVEGQLVVYAFDETDRPAHETQPTRRFIFPKEQFALLESESKLGASYSVWLPWDDIGGPMKKVSLIARFEPEDGPVVLGEQTRHMLPGALPSQQQLAATAPPIQAAVATPTPAVQLAGYNNPNPPAVSLPSSPHSNSSGSLPSARRVGEGGSQPEVSVLTAPRMNPATPLAQMSTMTIQLPRRLGAPPAMPQRAVGFTSAERDAGASPAASAPQPGATAPPTVPSQLPAQPMSPRPQTQSLRNSLLSTLPARVVPAAQPAPGRAR